MHVELAEREREFIRWARVARLATVDRSGRPHVVPVSPVLDGDLILFATDEESAKVRNLRANPAWPSGWTSTPRIGGTAFAA
jgi:predicted pyridoxine 5'-phosphate oxidase superfamily flavin-nucleotide-binding protein